MHRDACFFIFTTDVFDGFAEYADFDTVGTLALTQVVNILFTASPFLVGNNMENLLHSTNVFAKVTKY